MQKKYRLFILFLPVFLICCGTNDNSLTISFFASEGEKLCQTEIQYQVHKLEDKKRQKMEEENVILNDIKVLNERMQRVITYRNKGFLDKNRVKTELDNSQDELNKHQDIKYELNVIEYNIEVLKNKFYNC